MNNTLWQLVVNVPAVLADTVADIFSAYGDSVSVFEQAEGGPWVINAVCVNKPEQSVVQTQLALIAASHNLSEPIAEINALPQRDWLAENFASFQPLRLGRYFIHGSHYTGAKPSDAIDIQIDAATAFGSGDHGTTGGCLRALDKLADKLPVGIRALDMGCGSAILAIAAAKTWNTSAVAVDIDEESIRVAKINARDNGVEEKILTACGDGYATPLVAQHGPYDLILANILAGPLCAMAPDLARWLKPQGYAVLSGLLTSQEDQVLQAHTARGLTLTDRLVSGEWLTLVMRK